MKQKVLVVLLYIILIFYFRLAGDIVSNQSYRMLVWVILIYDMLVGANILAVFMIPRKSTDSPMTWQKFLYLAIPTIYWVGLGHLAILNAYNPDVYLSQFDVSIVYYSVLGMMIYVVIPVIIHKIIQSKRIKKDIRSLNGD